MAIATELTHKTQLSEDRHQSRPASRRGSSVDSPANSPDTIGSAQWILIFSATGIVWLVGLAIDLVIPFITFAMNYGVVFGLWIWAKKHNLKTPKLGSAAKGAGTVATVTTGAEAGVAIKAASALDNIPGSDLAYIALGGVTPLIYATALWWDNH